MQVNSSMRWVGVSLLVASLCVACGKRENVEKVLREDAIAKSKIKKVPIRPAAIVGQYEGVLPTNDAQTKSRTLIDLNDDATFTLNQTYIRPDLSEKDGKQPEANGSWIVNNDQTLIQIQIDSAVPGNITCFAVHGDSIVKYQTSCQPIDPAHPEMYTLKKLVSNQAAS
ncbi:MAG TPA: copper resistance protein NlpE N-terminal domain-containing protein [Aquirhabdus sp.]